MIKKILLLFLKGYKRVISPLLGQHCRFHPSCSMYTYNAIETHGVIKGMTLGVVRVIKCNPFVTGGYDPIPNKFEVKKLWKRKI